MSQDKDVAEALQNVADALIQLGNAGTTTPQGARLGGLEGLAVAMRDAAETIADGLHDAAEAIREAGRKR